MLMLLAEITAKPAEVEKVESILRGLVDFVGTEPGTVYYALHRQAENPCAFMVYELYKDQAACDSHLASVPLQSALKQFETLLAVAPKLTFCSTLATTPVG